MKAERLRPRGRGEIYLSADSLDAEGGTHGGPSPVGARQPAAVDELRRIQSPADGGG